MTFKPDDPWSVNPSVVDGVLFELSRQAEVPYVGAVEDLPTTFELFVPAAGDRHPIPDIPEGSAVIGVPALEGEGEQVRIFVMEPGDGNSGPRTFADRVLAAVGCFYEFSFEGEGPDVIVSRGELSLIGTFTPGIPGSKVELSSEGTLAEWLGESGGVTASELEESDEWRAEDDTPPDWN